MKMNTKVVLRHSVVLSVLVLLFFLVSCYSQPRVKFGDTVISVEVARTPDERAKGLMFRESLAENAGMLFVFEKEEPLTFWMKNTTIPLDMVFIAENGTITSISRASPCTAEPCQLYQGIARTVLEMNIDFTARHGIKQGDFVTLPKLD